MGTILGSSTSLIRREPLFTSMWTHMSVDTSLSYSRCTHRFVYIFYLFIIGLDLGAGIVSSGASIYVEAHKIEEVSHRSMATQEGTKKILESLELHGDAIVDQLKHLASISDDPLPAVTRVLFTETDVQGRLFIKSLMEDAGLEVSEDSMGSIFGSWRKGVEDPKAPAVLTGSHCDAIPLAGAYDGTVGVVAAIAALKALKTAGFKPSRPLQVVMFTSEEPTRFGLSCIGSRAMAGAISVNKLKSLRDVNETSFLDAAHFAGSSKEYTNELDILKSARLTEKEIKAFVELHIEQGPELEQENLQIGIVSAIAAPATMKVNFQGEGGHAGSLLMRRRNDAVLAAAELSLFIEQQALQTKSEDTVATAGKWEVQPNAVNSVPRSAILEIDVRDINRTRRDSILEAIENEARAISERRKCKLDMKRLSVDPPALSSDQVMLAIEHQVSSIGAKFKNMVSRAYHDSLFMAQIAPTGMIFIPCAGGKSHRPDEFASPQDIELGARILAGTLANLAGGDFQRSHVRDEL